MSSIVAVGPRLGIFGPPPVPPGRSLVKTPGVLVEEDAGRWMNGVVLQAYPHTNDVSQWNPCEDEEKTPGTATEQVTFDPVAIYLEFECSSITGDYEGMKDRLRTSLEAGTPRMVENILAAGGGAGITPNVNPFLGDSNVNVLLGGTAFAPREGLALLEDSIAKNYRSGGMIHASPGTVDMLSSVLEEDDEGALYTQAGTLLIPGQGYAGVSADGDAPGDTQEWMFASSPVEVRLSEITVTDLVSSLDRSVNDLKFIAERFALVVWDTALQTAVLVDWALATS